MLFVNMREEGQQSKFGLNYYPKDSVYKGAILSKGIGFWIIGCYYNKYAKSVFIVLFNKIFKIRQGDYSNVTLGIKKFID